MSARIEVVPYDPAWPEAFAAIREAVWPAVREVATAIEHVGSTSVPGLAAKPIIDLDIVVSDDDGAVTAAIAGLEAIAGHPDAAAALPPALLVRGLVRAHDHSERLATENEEQAARIAELKGEIHDLREDKAYLRGRIETLDQVIAALHANIQDLRLARDAASHSAVVEPGPAPRVLRPAPAELVEAAEA
jgi:predicted nuclease with TOPRIM domain